MKLDSKIFKAYDIRGKYPSELNEEAVFRIAQAMGKYFGAGSKVVIARDARISSPSLYKAALNGIRNQESGIRGKNKKSIIHNSKFIIQAGMITTPMFYFLVNKLEADGGIMITASHNPKEYNGLKIVGKKAVPMSGEEVRKLVIGKQ